MAVLDVPPTLEQVAELCQALLASLAGGAKELKTVLPADQLVSILRATEAELRAEASLVEISVEDPDAQVLVFGDTHGHFPDVAHM
jgi:serine/threonine-protein phosphatase 5